MLSRKLTLSLLGLAVGTFGFASTALSQSATVGAETVNIGTTEVSVPWNLEGGGGLRALNIDITFDTTLFTPKTDGTPQLDGCLAGVTASLQSCQAIGDGSVIRIALVQLPPGTLTDQSGVLAFDIVGAPGDGVVSPLSVVINNANPTGTVVAATSGSVTFQSSPPAVPQISPASWAAPSVLIGGTAPTQTFTIRNNAAAGALNLAINSIALEGATQFTRTGGTCVAGTTSLAPNSTCTVVVAMSTAASGTFNGTLRVGHNAGGADLTATLTGTVTAGPAPTLAITPNPQAFGSVLTNTTVENATLTVQNTGAAGSSAQIATIAGLSGALSVTGGTCVAGTTTLAQNQSCTITVAFAPTSDGAVNQTLTVTATDTINAGSVSATATVSGTGVSEARFSSNFAPGPVNLGSAGPAGSLDIDVEVSNPGNADLTLACTVDQDPAVVPPVFTIAPLNLTVPVGGTESFNVACDVPDLATYTATLSCTTNAPPPDNTVSWTFTCSGGEPVPIPTMQSWGLILFALMMLLVGGITIRFFRA